MFCLLVHVTSPSIRGGRLGRAGCGDTLIASSQNHGRRSSPTHGQWHQGTQTNDTKEIKELLGCGFDINGDQRLVTGRISNRPKTM